MDRKDLSHAVQQKEPAGLRMLITDTCSNRLSEDVSDDSFARYTIAVRAKASSYIEDLFLGHEGFLDITSASPGQVAIAHKELGGHFTSALVSQGFTARADKNEDNFLSWEEAFAAAREGTMELYSKAAFGSEMAVELRETRQQTQEPVAYGELPKPHREGDVENVVSQSPIPVPSTFMLNFTSVPSGAEVSIDGFTVGQTPLKDYSLESTGQQAKEIEVKVEADGYGSVVKQFRVRRGVPFEWAFELEQEASVLARLFTGGDGREMVLIPAGEFEMGSNHGDGDEKPVHSVYVDAFYMDKYAVTNAAYKKFVDANPQWQKNGIPSSLHDGDYLGLWDANNNYPVGKANHPVVDVSWYAAVAYSKWAGKRLPTEAEWEKAARGGLKGMTYPWGNTIDPSRANYHGSIEDTTAVGQYAANGYGLFDMAGNVWEWCLDEYRANFYSISPARNSLSGANSIMSILDNYTGIKSYRVLRGGSTFNTVPPVRVANRESDTPTRTDYLYGFRCARSVSP